MAIHRTIVITCSNIRAQGADYLTRHLSSNDYYSEGESIVGTWFGVGAERLGLVPGSEVAKEDFAAIGNNRKPDGSKLTALDMPDRKSWTDVQVSCPKDVSILALVAGDERLTAAFDEAADVAMRAMQDYAGTRERRGELHGSEETRRTGNIIAAKYRHDASRALDPQLHRHFVVANATWDKESGRFMALQSRDMMLASKYARRVMYDHLAASCERMGYKVTNESDSGFDIKGVTDALREKYSQREAQIDTAAKAFEVANGREPSAKERAVLTRESRDAKLEEITTAEVRAYQRGRLDPAEQTALAELVASAAALPAASFPSPTDLDTQLDGALAHVTERKSVVHEWDALEAVYAHRPAGTRLDVAAVVERLKERTTGPNADLHVGFGSRLTTAEVAREEAETVRLALSGRGACAPLASLNRLDAAQVDAEAKPGADRLADDQLAAARLLAGTRDRVSVMIGDAGTGKTFLLQRLRDASDSPWIALGPTTRARDELKANGFKESETVAAFLKNPAKQADAHGATLLVDEAGLLDMGQMKSLLEVARANDARVLLVGDPKQHNAVGRGDALRAVLDGARHAVAASTVKPYVLEAEPKDPAPLLDLQAVHERNEHHCLELTPDAEKESKQLGHEFTTLEEKGAATRRPGLVVARLQTVRRQIPQAHREVSDLLAKGQVSEALDKQVNELKTVEEIKNEKRLFSSAANHYMERREILAADRGRQPGRSPDVLGVCRTWEDIGRFSGEVRERMRECGQLGEDRTMQIVQPSGWTEEEKTVAAKYQPEKHVVTFQGKVESIGAKTGENWSVEAVDADGLTLRRLNEAAPRKGQKRQPSPQPRKIGWDDLRGVEVGERKEIPLAPGDQIQFRANCRDGKKAVANNGDVRQIKSIGKDGRLNLVGGGQVPTAFKNYCHGYAVTSHKSQGASVRETVVVMGTAACSSADVQSNYVNMTRHKEGMRAFVADLNGMRSSLLRSAARGPGRELVREMPVAPVSTHKAKQRPGDVEPSAASVASIRPAPSSPSPTAKAGEPVGSDLRTVSPVPGEDSALRPMAVAPEEPAMPAPASGEDSALRPMAVAPEEPAMPAPASGEGAIAVARAKLAARTAKRGASVLLPASSFFGATSTGKAKPIAPAAAPVPAVAPEKPAAAPAPAPVVKPASVVAPVLSPVQAAAPALVAKPARGFFSSISSTAAKLSRAVDMKAIAGKIEVTRQRLRKPRKTAVAVAVPVAAPAAARPVVAKSAKVVATAAVPASAKANRLPRMEIVEQPATAATAKTKSLRAKAS